MFAFAWFILGLCATIPALLDKDIYAVINDLPITILPLIVYFVVKHQIKNEADEFSDMLLKKEEFYNANNNKVQEEPSNTPDIYEEEPLLIKCPACGKEVSNQAVSCPNCGHPIAEMVKEKELEEEAKQIARYSQIEEYGKKKHKNNKNKSGCSGGCVTFIFLLH